MPAYVQRKLWKRIYLSAHMCDRIFSVKGKKICSLKTYFNGSLFFFLYVYFSSHLCFWWGIFQVNLLTILCSFKIKYGFSMQSDGSVKNKDINLAEENIFRLLLIYRLWFHIIIYNWHVKYFDEKIFGLN